MEYTYIDLRFDLSRWYSMILISFTIQKKKKLLLTNPLLVLTPTYKVEGEFTGFNMSFCPPISQLTCILFLCSNSETL